MAFTQTQLSALEEAIASGTLSVKYDGLEQTFRDSDHLISTYRFIKSELDTLTRNPAAVVTFV